MTADLDVTQMWRALCSEFTCVDARCTVLRREVVLLCSCVGPQSLQSLCGLVGCAPVRTVLRRPLILADVVANIAAAAAAAAVTAAERGRETKGHGSKAEAPHLYRR